jgi:hypothetical protein
LAKEERRDREIRIVDRNAPRFDEKQRPATASLFAHLTVTNLSGTEAKKIIIKAIEKARQIKTLCDRTVAPERRPYFTLDFE